MGKKCKNTSEKITLLWIVVMFIMAFTDIFTFMIPGVLSDLVTGNAPIKITQELMLIMAIINTIPIAMIYLSGVLSQKINRWLNIIASIITIIYIVGGYSDYLHYYYFGALEVLCLLGIIRYAWKWKILSLPEEDL